MAKNVTKLKINGMTCDHCVESVQSALSAVPGVSFVDVSIEENTATVEYDDEQATAEDFKIAVDESGFGAELIG